MRNYKLLIVAFVLVVVGMLCGCSYNESIDIECDGLEEDERVFVLVKPTDDDELRTPDDADITGSEIYTAGKDGFVLAEQLREPISVEISGEQPQLNCSLIFKDSESRRNFCEKHKVIRLAVCDDRWRIKKISDDIDVFFPEEYEVLDAGRYYVGTGEFENTDIVSAIDTSRVRASGAILCFAAFFLLWPINAVQFIVMLVMTSKKRQSKPRNVFLWFGVLSVPNLFFSKLYLSAVDVFDLILHNSRSLPDALSGLLLIDFPWLAELLLLLVWYIFLRQKDDVMYKGC